MRHKTQRRSRSRAILLVLLAVALATAGVVYAHWTETLQVNSTVQTGSVGLAITAASTDDDGKNNGWDGATDDGGPVAPWFDAHGTLSSADPSSYRLPAYATPRYDKDVARCWVTTAIPVAGVDAIAVQVQDAYPSYHCTIRSAIKVTGTIPLRNQAVRVEVCSADCGIATNWQVADYDVYTDLFVFDADGDDLDDVELVMQNAAGGVCGYQFDPGANATWAVGLHVLQDAPQSHTYQVRFKLEQVNWNEWSLSNCYGFDYYVDPPGTPVKPIVP